EHALILHHRDDAAGLSAIVAIHAWRDGRACGGCRMLPYANASEALQDVLRLSRAMSYKAALANVAAGGAKAVIVGDPKRQKSDALLLAMGRLIGMFDGRYVAAPDVGIGVDDLRVFLEVSPWVCGASTMAGPSAPYTALGVFAAMKAAVKHRLKRDNLSGLKVALQGVGSVGSELA